MTAAGYELRPVGRVESALTDADAAPKQGDEGAPEAWLVFVAEAAPAARDLRPGTDVLVLTPTGTARGSVGPRRRAPPPDGESLAPQGEDPQHPTANPVNVSGHRTNLDTREPATAQDASRAPCGRRHGG
ncbi:tRNA (N6-threonylcarbamoyladenosine(37)-N6)-methyltransferase TrmO [Micromonospora sp. ATA32]|nr:tRNA (N6-threonylcarbamoyladenosine(37)-N6)-methyltransferase TrmO [Micromonospora sp. ATA32]